MLHDFGVYERLYNIINIWRINENSLNGCKYSQSFELWDNIFAGKILWLTLMSVVHCRRGLGCREALCISASA
jgi:predicted AlkP superfamily pyrophosphatase or phosphodiesterase